MLLYNFRDGDSLCTINSCCLKTTTLTEKTNNTKKKHKMQHTLDIKCLKHEIVKHDTILQKYSKHDKKQCCVLGFIKALQENSITVEIVRNFLCFSDLI